MRYRAYIKKLNFSVYILIYLANDFFDEFKQRDDSFMESEL